MATAPTSSGGSKGRGYRRGCYQHESVDEERHVCGLLDLAASLDHIPLPAINACNFIRRHISRHRRNNFLMRRLLLPIVNDDSLKASSSSVPSSLADG